MWRGHCSTQRQARELISVPDLAMGARLMSFNRTQTRVVVGLLTGHNTLRRHLHIMGLCNDAICRKCGTDKTKYMVMSRDRNAGRGHSVKMDNSSIERVEEFKYLLFRKKLRED